jgi:hypothetical protein
MKYQKLFFNYNKEILINEIFQNEKDFVDIPATKEYLQYRPFDIVDKTMYEKVTTVSGVGIQKGILPSWRGFSFTHVPKDPITNYGGNLSRLKHEEWTWKPTLECSYIKSLVLELGFTQIQNIRVMVIEPPGFGPVHLDVPPGVDYYKDHVSITLNVEDGGVPLIAMIDGKLTECNDPCFIFQDDCWHGVGVVKSRRTQLRINGKVDQNQLDLYKQSSVI